MALAHFWMQSLSRNKPALPASVAVHYLKREAEFAPAAYLSRTSDSTKDRTDLRDSGVQHLPAWAQANPGKFFSAAERYEGGNRYHAIMLQFSLPREMTHVQHMALMHDFIDATMHDKPLLWVKHEPLDRFSHEPQPHIHILLSARTVDGIERDEVQTFKRWDRNHAERGGCEKDLFWSRRQAPEQLRHAFADLTNMHAERAGLALRIDSRSLRRRDIDRKPMYKEEDRPSRDALVTEQLQASAAWERRKVYKGLDNVRDLSREEMVLLVRQWTREYPQGKQLERVASEVMQAWSAQEQKRLREEQATLESDLAQATLAADRGHVQVMTAEHRTRQHASDATDDLTRVWAQPVIANRASGIYHTPAHKNYGEVVPANQEHFWTEQAAQEAGYRRAANDHYGRGSGKGMEKHEGSLRRAPSTSIAGPGEPAEGRPGRRGSSPSPRAKEQPPGQPRASVVPLLDDEDLGGLLAPDLDKKRGRDGHDW